MSICICRDVSVLLEDVYVLYMIMITIIITIMIMTTIMITIMITSKDHTTQQN